MDFTSITMLALGLLRPEIIFSMVIGVIFGIIFGSIPGLTITTAVVLIIPITYTMTPLTAISTMISVYIGGMSGGLISAILLRMPGTSSAVATTFDGYPMAQNGEAAKALGIGISASLFGGLFSSIALLIIAPQLTKVALQFGPLEYFSIAVFALSLVSILVKGDVIKGIFTAMLGLVFGFVGSSPIDGTNRLTFGNSALNGGFKLLVVIIGLFALSELFSTSQRVGERVDIGNTRLKMSHMLPSIKDFFSKWRNLLRSSVIGTFIGILPGLGGGPGGMISYALAKRASKDPDSFGFGNPEGIYASETANNAVTGGALIPLITLGIPGDVVAAVLLGGFLIHGVSVGPLLFNDQPEITYSIILSVFLANLIMFGVMLIGIKFFVRILKTPRYLLLPLIIVFCVVGVLGINSRTFDVHTMVFFGVIGYVLEKNRYPLPPFILSFILGPMIEENLRRSLMYYGNIGSALTTFSIGSVFLALSIILPIAYLLLGKSSVQGIEKKEES